MTHRLLLPGCAALLLSAGGCGGGGTDDPGSMNDSTAHRHTNRLVHESSPYLLQHAHNPVDWYPWGQEAFDSARAQNKLVLISVGYSSCHWCHVMERESFENDSIAELMNERFICIKVDREERPDVDQVYMGAVQLMTGRGGWPLNCFALPDGRPVYGGTYFAPAQWRQLLQDLGTTWAQEPDRVRSYADRLQQGIAELDLVVLNEDPAPFSRKELDRFVDAWEKQFDNEHGGPDRAPKFPMPNNYLFLLQQAWLTNDPALKAHVKLTLDRMARGGLFDQVGGGFARYSTDVLWKVPHFEKMLYDNAQLVSLYSQAWKAYGDPEHRRVVERTLAFLEREMRSPEGAYFSALDADSEGEEGRFYVWTEEELRTVLGTDHELAMKLYAVGGEGLWEHGRNILLRPVDDSTFAQRNGMDPAALRTRIDAINTKLLEARAGRERPGLDDKALVSWNALTVQAYADAYEALGTPAYLEQAKRTMALLLGRCRRPDGGLWHSYKNGKATINGYLEDYCFTIEALLALYGVTFDEAHVREAEKLAEYAIAHFHDSTSAMFHFTSDLDPPLVARRKEVNDNVIPASNSSMAKGLFLLGHLLDRPRYLALSEQMLQNVKGQMDSYPGGYSNWALLMQAHVFPFHEIAITGPDAQALRLGFGRHYVPNAVFLGGPAASTLPLLEGKLLPGASTIYVCQNKTCRMPVGTVDEALRQLR
ncbi:MAG TPA: thioredoxin domain-containing protein [Flavobacteriales bacterium]|nr:thioredoxin domain-containing protein [Flavobacteriales bacterium]HMR27155.1 thioredoxin domain-containing protein [Flavobacteriales bacterium]